MKDFFENAPDIVIDKILEKLPICVAAQTGVLSKKWLHAWLSLQSLIFDFDFQEQQQNEDECYDWPKSSRIISRILLHHNCPIRRFDLFVPEDEEDAREKNMDLKRWIYFISNKGVRRISIIGDFFVNIPSNIFWCSELVYLKLDTCLLDRPPTCFHGFPKLKHLHLLNVWFDEENTLCSLIENCRMLVTLKLEDWYGMDHVVIDAPSIQTLIINGEFESLAFRNVCSLVSISVSLRIMPVELVTVETVDAVNLLASPCQLQSIKFNGHLCKFLAADGIIRSTSVSFNHLEKLFLIDLNLNDFVVFRYVLSMIESCPYIKTLAISVIQGEIVGQHNLNFNHSYKLDHLLEVNIEGITGSDVELKLVEYLLSISASLENLFFKCGKCDTDSELKMSKALMRFPRASTKAELVCLE